MNANPNEMLSSPIPFETQEKIKSNQHLNSPVRMARQKQYGDSYMGENISLQDIEIKNMDIKTLKVYEKN